MSKKPNSNRLMRLAGRIYDVPLAIERHKLETILGVLGERIGLEAFDFAPETPDPHQSLDVGPGIAVIEIVGTLVQREVNADPMSGLVSYEGIAAQFAAAMADSAVRAVVFDIDSPGGEVNGLFDLADMIYNARGQKPSLALVNETATSAAYTLASSANRVVMPRTGATGSIGVIAVHIDVSERDKMQGMKWTPITSGTRKAEGNPHQPLTDTARASIQAEVDRVAGILFQTISRNRGIKEDAIRALQGAVVYGDDAVAQGLIDALAPVADGIKTLQGDLARRSRSGGLLTSLSNCGNRIASRNAAANLAKKLSGAGDMTTLAKRINAVIDGKVSGDLTREAILEDVASKLEAAGVEGKTLDQLLAGEVTEKEAGESLEKIAAALGVDRKALMEPDPVPDKPASKSADVVAIESAKKESIKYATEVTELCALAGRPEMAADFLREQISLDVVRKKLLTERAATDRDDISSSHAPGGKHADHNWDRAAQKAGCKLKQA